MTNEGMHHSMTLSSVDVFLVASVGGPIYCLGLVWKEQWIDTGALQVVESSEVEGYPTR